MTSFIPYNMINVNLSAYNYIAVNSRRNPTVSKQSLHVLAKQLESLSLNGSINDLSSRFQSMSISHEEVHGVQAMDWTTVEEMDIDVDSSSNESNESSDSNDSNEVEPMDIDIPSYSNEVEPMDIDLPSYLNEVEPMDIDLPSYSSVVEPMDIDLPSYFSSSNDSSVVEPMDVDFDDCRSCPVEEMQWDYQY